MLDVEKSKSADANEPGNIRTSVGKGSSYFDSGALSEVLEQRTSGSIELSAERLARIEDSLKVLQAWSGDTVLVQFVGQVDSADFGDFPELQIVGSDNPCDAATQIYEKNAAEFSGLFAALRVAALEVEGNYDPAVHDSWFASFDWQAFSGEEMQLVTRVVALVSADHLAGDGLPAFSRLLGSRMPVHVMSWVRAYDNPGASPDEGPFDAYRFELAYFCLLYTSDAADE